MANTYDHTAKNAELVSAFSSRIAGSTILVTGVSLGGLGHKFLKEVLVANPATLVLAGRTLSKVQATADEITSERADINVKTLRLDLASFKSVREAVQTVNGWDDVSAIDVLVNNAGIMCPPFSLTEDGNENQWQSNHLGPFLFTNLIMDKILASSSPRIVSVGSNGARYGGIRFWDPNFSDGKFYDPFKAYAQTKTANLLFAVSLASKLSKRGLHAYSMHPGVVLGTALALGSYTTPDQFLKDMATAEDTYGTKYGGGSIPQTEFKDQTNSVATHILTAFSPDIETEELNGKYFFDAHVADPWKGDYWSWARDPIDAERLWKLSEEMVGQTFEY